MEGLQYIVFSRIACIHFAERNYAKQLGAQVICVKVNGATFVAYLALWLITEDSSPLHY